MENTSLSSEDLVQELEDLELDEKPSGERWAPLGANDPDDTDLYEPCHSHYIHYSNVTGESDRLRELEEQQEILNSSLIALTSHFAQVQFRLRQIVDAPPSEKDNLLKHLEAFAFRGIPEMENFKVKKNEESLENKIVAQKEKQKELISQLKIQLEDLEKYAYETGEAGLPQSLLMEKQKVLIDQLKGKLNLNLEMDKITLDDLRTKVDTAISQLVNPLKTKEHLVNQLKTQIGDLERFIEFLQGETTNETQIKLKACTCDCPVHYKHKSSGKLSYNKDEEIRAETINIMKKAATLLQMFAVSQFGCSSDHFTKNSLKKTMKANHYGDLRARLELAVARVLELAQEPEHLEESAYMSDSEDAPTPAIFCNGKLTASVRRGLALAVRDLMAHGLTTPVAQGSSLVPFIGCFHQMHHSSSSFLHPWELILKYYHLKNGETFNSTPARKLSESFNLDIIGGTAISQKQNLLSTIGTIINTHTKYKRSYDSHFKAFICASLNSKRLVTWLRLIFRCQHLLELFYQPWSYVAKTGFEDSFHILDKLSSIKFDLPVDLAVRQFQNMKDAF